MRQIIVVIKDQLIGCGSLMSFPNPESAIRSFKEIINGDNQIARNAHDHELLAIGGYDTEKGSIVAYSEPRILAKGKDLKPKYANLAEANRPENKVQD